MPIKAPLGICIISALISRACKPSMISYIVLRIHLIKILTINYCVTQVILASAIVSQNFRVHVVVG